MLAVKWRLEFGARDFGSHIASLRVVVWRTTTHTRWLQHETVCEIKMGRIVKYDAPQYWRAFFKSPIERGLYGIELVTSDAHAGLNEARKACFPGVPWQRCRFHLMRNALAHVPREEMKREVIDDLKSVLDSANEQAAGEQLGRVVRKYQKPAPKLAQWMEENVPESFAVFHLPPTHRVRLRTTNMLERVNKELKRRTRVATLFPNQASLLRLVTAVLMELSEEWETGKRYLTFETK